MPPPSALLPGSATDTAQWTAVDDVSAKQSRKVTPQCRAHSAANHVNNQHAQPSPMLSATLKKDKTARKNNEWRHAWRHNCACGIEQVADEGVSAFHPQWLKC